MSHFSAKFALGPALAAALMFALSAHAGSYDGTWAGGWDKVSGVQVIVAGDEVIGFYLGGDYRPVTRSNLAPGGGAISFAWADGDAVLRPKGTGSVLLVLRQRGQAERRIVLKRG